jgi:hypothetical protein
MSLFDCFLEGVKRDKNLIKDPGVKMTDVKNVSIERNKVKNVW